MGRHTVIRLGMHRFREDPKRLSLPQIIIGIKAAEAENLLHKDDSIAFMLKHIQPFCSFANLSPERMRRFFKAAKPTELLKWK